MQYAAALRFRNPAEVQAARGNKHTHQRKTHCNLVGDYLGGGTHGAQERILGIGCPAGDDDAVHGQRGQRQDIQQPCVDIRQHQGFVKRNYRPRGQGRRHGKYRRDDEQALVCARRYDDFLENELHYVRNGLSQAPQAKPEKADPVWAQPALDIAYDLAFGVGQVSDTEQQGKQYGTDFDQDFQGVESIRGIAGGYEQADCRAKDMFADQVEYILKHGSGIPVSSADQRNLAG